MKVFEVSNRFGVTQAPMPHLLCAHERQLMIIRMFASYKSEQGFAQSNQRFPNKRPLYVDTTYDLCDCFLTVFGMMHPCFVDERTGKEPFVPVSCFLSYYRETADYREAGNLLRKALNLESKRTIYGLITDDESALHGGLKENDIFDEVVCTHVLCELHLKKNCEAKLKQCGADSDTIGHVLYQIFGGELQVTNFGDQKDATRIGREKTEYKENWSCRFAEVSGNICCRRASSARIH